ncbi:hypothetical protein, partial [Paenarthrobacter nicotinovorans]|uniref:hypothetical protein n=1 Tax=Paenarthrobacter nicotinovorans TaxID=29320 RepID=UPI0024858F31
MSSNMIRRDRSLPRLRPFSGSLTPGLNHPCICSVNRTEVASFLELPGFARSRVPGPSGRCAVAGATAVSYTHLRAHETP